jgi:hypothetical protein
VSSIPRYTEAWNDFLKKYQGDCEDYDRPRVVVGRFISGVDWSMSGNSNREMSMMKFLQDKTDVYFDVEMTLFNTTNSFGI